MGKKTFDAKYQQSEDDLDSKIARNIKLGPKLNHMQNQQTEDIAIVAGVQTRRANNISNKTSDDFVVNGREGSPIPDDGRPKRVSRITEGEPASVIFNGAEVDEGSPNRASRSSIRTSQVPEPAPFVRYPIRPMDDGYTSCTSDFQ